MYEFEAAHKAKKNSINSLYDSKYNGIEKVKRNSRYRIKKLFTVFKHVFQ